MEAVEDMEKQTGGIVVGYDGSSSAQHAVEWAAREAKRRGRPLTVLSVMDYGGLGYAGPVGLAHWWPDVAVEHGRKLSAEGADRAREITPDLEVTPETQVGPTAAVLIETSRTAELMVVGSRGHGELRNLAIGSVAAGLAAHGRCPVVIVRGEGNVFTGPAQPVVVGIDGSAPASVALAFAASLADQAASPLTVVCAWNALAEDAWVDAYARGGGPHDPDLRPAERRVAQAALDTAVASVRAEHPAVAVTPSLVEGPPAPALLEAGAEAGLLVVGTRGHGAFTSLLLGSVSHAVVHAATRPVAVVRGGISDQVRRAEAAIPAVTADQPPTGA
jgi:nucleotide-binding universal stress UspA family protein